MAEADTTKTTVAAPKNPKAAAAADKPKKEPKPPKYAPTSVITLLKNKDGKQYGDGTGETVMPKRGKSAERFKLYKQGMTIQALTDAYAKAQYTNMNGDVDWDIAHGFIEVKKAA